MSDHRLDLSAKYVPPESGGLVRGRLLDVRKHRVGLVLAPAGHGKTTLLGQIAAQFEGQIAWYRLDVGDRNPAGLTARLGRVLTNLLSLDDVPHLPGAPSPAVGDPFEHLAAVLSDAPVHRDVLLVLDDFHTVAGTDSERGLVQLIAMAPRSLRVVLGARRAGGLDVEALRLYGGARVLDAEDLRFRSWEVETLFREVYRQPLLPADAAVLTQRTEGWAAGLAMFHLLTAGRAPAQRRRALADLSRGSKLVRSYLVREVLGDLPPTLRDFLRRTSALGVLTGDLCDSLLETTGSQAVLEELEHRRLFTTSQDDGRQFAYHQVLLDHLELELTEHLGPPAGKAWYGRAAALLLAAGEVPAAFRAYARAEDWAAVEQLLHVRGAEVVAGPLGPVENLLPVDLHSQDPWLLLARARRLVEAGQSAEAVATFKLAHAVAEDAALAARCLEESRSAALWLPEAVLPEMVPPSRGWPALVRAATQRNPRLVLPAALELPGPTGRLAAAVVSLLAGDPAAASLLAAEATDHPEADYDVVAMAAGVQSLVAVLTAPSAVLASPNSTGGPSGLDALMLETEVGRRPWLLRTVRTLVEGRSTPIPGADPDQWGRALVTFIDGLVQRSLPSLSEAASLFEALGSPVPATWAACCAAALSQSDRAGVTGQRARALGLRDALPVIERWAGPSLVVSLPEPSFGISLLGGLSIAIDGAPLDLRPARPRARSALRLLALRAGEPVHREYLAAQLWPDLDQEAGLRSLQVAVSALRGLLDRGQVLRVQLVREGQNYCLVLPTGCLTDVQSFEARLAEARAARSSATSSFSERSALDAALRLYTGELLPEEGPAEWVLADRDRLRQLAAGAAESLARCLSDRPDEAIEALRTCLRLDPYRDNAWRRLIDLHSAAGNAAAAEAARQEHAQVLTELGVLPT